MKHILAVILLCTTFSVFGQKMLTRGTAGNLSGNQENSKSDSVSTGLWKNPNKIQDYKIYTLQNDTTFVDTTLTIQTNYKFNYLRKDYFELLPFSNMGQTYNRLSLDKETSLFPQMGQRSKYFNFYEVEDVNYYQMPTPVTELFFKTTMEQGQMLDASIAFNTSKQLNFYIAYKGMRSLGKYQNIRSSTGNFRFSSNYHSKNDRYDLKWHYVAQDLSNQENVGIVDNEYFITGEEDFSDRARFDVIAEDADNILVAKRYFVQQQYNLIHSKDSLQYNIVTIGHKLNYETKFYRYNQGSAIDYFGDSYVSSNIEDRTKLRAFGNEVFAKWSNNIVGDISFKVKNYNYNYLFRSVTNINGVTIPSRFSGNETALGASYQKKVGGFQLYGSLAQTVVGDLGGTDFVGKASFNFGEANSVEASLNINSRMPDFNYLMYQSDYVNYNWYNVDAFEKEQTNTLKAVVNLKKIANVGFEYSILNNYAYFQGESSETDNDSLSIVAPKQFGGTINYLKLKLQREFKVGKFALDNTLMYQEVAQDEDVLNVPTFVTRNTLYFATDMFKKNLYVQTGVTFKYFTEYYANRYNPLLSEFSVQNNQNIGDFPLFDVFLNFKVRQARFYFKAEHLNSLLGKENNYYSAPNNPYRDFIIRFGLVWNLFS